jgi:hypothetical protein
VNVDAAKLTPGVFGLSHGSGAAGMIIRDATGSWAGHAFGNVGGGQLVQGQPPVAALAPVTSHDDAIWAWRMWDQLMAEEGWTADRVHTAQTLVTGRYDAEVGCKYDYPAYLGFTEEVLKLRTAAQLAPEFAHDNWRVCSALVADGLMAGGVPLKFVPEDGPGIIGSADRAPIPANLVAPGMLLGLAQRLEWL